MALESDPTVFNRRSQVWRTVDGSTESETGNTNGSTDVTICTPVDSYTIEGQLQQNKDNKVQDDLLRSPFLSVSICKCADAYVSWYVSRSAIRDACLSRRVRLSWGAHTTKRTYHQIKQAEQSQIKMIVYWDDKRAGLNETT